MTSKMGRYQCRRDVFKTLFPSTISDWLSLAEEIDSKIFSTLYFFFIRVHVSRTIEFVRNAKSDRTYSPLPEQIPSFGSAWRGSNTFV